MIKSWLLFILQTDFFTLRYNNNTHSNALCTNWHIEKRLVYQGRKGKLYDSGQLWNITELPIIKWKKKITNFCRLLTCLYLLKRLNPRQESSSLRREVFCLGEQRGQRLVIPWAFSVCSSRTQEELSEMEHVGKWGKMRPCSWTCESDLTEKMIFAVKLKFYMWDHPGSSSWALNPGTGVLKKKHWEKTQWEKGRRSPCEDGGREWR